MHADRKTKTFEYSENLNVAVGPSGISKINKTAILIACMVD